jgi:glycosyltransferase involved in cell wall biosynthesis
MSVFESLTAPVPDAAASANKPTTLIIGTFLSSCLVTHSVCEELATRLKAAGWTVLTSSAKPGRIARLLDMVGAAWRQRLRYRVAQVDVYSGPAFLWAEAVCAVLSLAGKPYILTLHGGNLPAFSRRWPRRVRRLLASARVVTAPSRYLLQEMDCYRTDLRLLPNALSVDAHTECLRSPASPRLMWVRGFHETYNPSLAPKALALLSAEFSEIRLTMIGPDKGDGSLARTRRVAAELGVLDRLYLPGGVPKSEIPGWLKQADIFLNTTNVDNTPITVLEAMAAGMCIVSTNAGGIRRLLEHETDALIVPPDNPAAMAAAVRRILNEPVLAAHLSRHARRRAEQFDWSIILPQWEALLTAVATDAKVSRTR